MDSILKLAAARSMEVKLNHSVCNGISVEESKNTIPLLEDIIRYTFDNRIDGFTFHGLKRVSPEDTANLTRVSNSFDGYDINKTNVYLVEAEFRYEYKQMKEVIKRQFLLPYPDDGGLMYLSGALYNARVVLTDKSISPSSNNVFVRLYKDKSNIQGLPYFVIRDGKTTTSNNVTFLKPYFNKSPAKKKNTPKPTLIHYLLTVYGYKGCMMKLLGYVPKLVYTKDLDKLGDKSNYIIYSSIGTFPYKTIKMRSKRQFYKPTEINIVVPREKHLNFKLLDVVATAFFYVVDHYPELKISEVELKGQWEIWLGIILHGDNIINELHSKMSMHLKSISKLVDISMVKRLKLEFGDSLGEDFEEDGYYGIMMAVFKNYDMWIIAANNISASCYDKRLENLYFILYHVIVAINKLSYELSSIKPGNINDLRQRINKSLTPGMIYKMKNRKANEVVVVDLVTVASDNRLHGVTTNTCLQLNLRSSGATTSSKSNADPADPSTLLSETHMIGGTLNAITKSRLSPLSTVNIFAPYKNGTIVPTKNMLESTKSLKDILSKMTRNSSKVELPEEFKLTIKDL